MVETKLNFFTEENVDRIQEIVKELKIRNNESLNIYISCLEELLSKITTFNENLRTQSDFPANDEVFLDQNAFEVFQCMAGVFKHLSETENFNIKDKNTIDLIKEYIYKNSTESQNIVSENPPSADSFVEQTKYFAPVGKARNLPINDVKKIRAVAVDDLVKDRMRHLEAILPNCPHPSLKTRGMVEYKALGLLDFQRTMRNRVAKLLIRDRSMELVPNLRAFRRPRRFSDRYIDRVQGYQGAEDEKRQRRFNRDLLHSLVNASKEFKEFHRATHVKIIRITKTVSIYHSNQDKEKKKEEDRVDKERLRRLMMEDEEGYRKLLDEKKDRRIHYLLNQTDEFIKSIMDLVSKHKELRILEDLNIDDDENIQIPAKINPPKISENSNQDSTALNKSTLSQDVKKDLYANDDIDLSFKDKTPPLQTRDIAAYYKIAHSVGEEIKVQPSILEGGHLKEYQLKGLEWMVSLYNNKLNGILADEMGLGKTIQTIAFFAYLFEVKRITGPHIVIVPLSTISNWQIELQKWCPKLDVVCYKGPGPYRKQMAPKVKTVKFNVLLTTYEYVMKDKSLLSKIQWKYMIVDEGHRMKNQDCKLTYILNSYYKAPYRLLLTGTPLQNRLPELWALLNFLLPNIFNCCTTFEQWFNAPFANTGEKVELNEEEKYLIIRRLHKILRPFLLRRLKKEVESQLPDKVEYVIKCQMSCLQKMMYHLTQKNSSALFQGSTDSSRKSQPKMLMNTLMQLRKVCNHPFLFPHIEESFIKKFASETLDPLHSPLIYRVSGKFELLDRILPKLKSLNHRCLIFCQMTQLMSILEDYLNFAQYKYLRLDGTTKSEDRGRLLELFNAENSPYFIFILSTRAGGLGLNLQSADTVIIFDSDWNPQQDLQAQDRAHRIGQKNEVRVLRLMTVNSIEERILAAAKFKLNLDEKVIQAGMFNQSSTSKERKAFLEALLDTENPNDADENEVPDDDTLNQMISRSEEEYEIYQVIIIIYRKWMKISYFFRKNSQILSAL